ncbi:toxin-antitoxin system TumE family protein [Rhizobium terrae]|uniref:toxin-antitoxin system TumE family protein n=1 Tax=Rhizobium terrae TaxID=2171756 RepID=UPI000E3C49DA|nr:DUF6516 family protein [Rhizobium terrae]
MTGHDRDTSLDTLLDLHGRTLFVDPEGKYWVKFVVIRVEASEARPHGLSYSLTLHDDTGERIVGFDNAHPISEGSGPSARRTARYDHRHRLRTIRPYDYSDAGTLLEDFWKEVDAVLRERGVI